MNPTPISEVQARAVRAGELPPVEEIRPGVWTFAVPFRIGSPDATLTYAIEAADGSVVLVDPGWGTDETLLVVDDALRSIGKRTEDVGLVAVTHLHVDHLGAAAAIRARSGAAVAMHGAELVAIEQQVADREADEADIASWGIPDALRAGVSAAWGSGRSLPSLDRDGNGDGGAGGVVVDIEVRDGDVLPIPGRTLRALHTPGHTTGHLCFVDEQDGLLFTGDHVLPRINSGLGLGGRSASNPLDDYLASLRLLDPFGALEVCPGHEYRFADVVDRARTLADHRAERSAFIGEALDGLDRPTLFEVASRVPFRGGIDSMSGYLLASALAQTAFHVRSLGRSDEVRPA